MSKTTGHSIPVAAQHVADKYHDNSSIVIHAHEDNTDLIYILVSDDSAHEAGPAAGDHTTSLVARGHYVVEPHLEGRVTVAAKSAVQQISVSA